MEEAIGQFVRHIEKKGYIGVFQVVPNFSDPGTKPADKLASHLSFWLQQENKIPGWRKPLYLSYLADSPLLKAPLECRFELHFLEANKGSSDRITVSELRLRKNGRGKGTRLRISKSHELPHSKSLYMLVEKPAMAYVIDAYYRRHGCKR